ncbi:DUF2244 domain-containing protein [Roseococcus sp. DSY-14]|uniref:DUF2244 domain-containing protein n=1 Tax=Roseococcus sp. DSY-14 TaxID=3369650 RepID=UPI00387B8CB2
MAESPALFESRTQPPQGLQDQGFRVVCGVLMAGFTFTGTVFTLMGAWPVLVFASVETALAIGLLALYRLHARRSVEWVMLTQGRLLVRRQEGGRRLEAEFDPFWARLGWEGEERLVLRHRQRAVEIGRFLAPDDKKALERALAEALRLYRNPVFDNPQLR